MNIQDEESINLQNIKEKEFYSRRMPFLRGWRIINKNKSSFFSILLTLRNHSHYSIYKEEIDVLIKYFKHIMYVYNRAREERLQYRDLELALEASNTLNKITYWVFGILLGLLSLWFYWAR